MLKEKVERSREIIKMVGREYTNPIINSGFGKDSICLVHLCKKDLGLDWPIMFYRDPYFPRKYRYANMIIDKWNLTCFNYPARSTSVFNRNGTFEVVRHYGLGGNGNLALCAMLYTPHRFIEGEYLCGLRDIYQQPRGDYEYRWDICLSGHRSVETKPHSGNQASGIRWDLKHNVGSCDVAYPLRDWTDEETYQYMVDNGIPINTDVYEVKNGALVPKIDPATGEIDSTYNPDRRPACFECMKPENPIRVLCPKRMCSVNSVASSLVMTVMPTDHVWAEENQKKTEKKEVKKRPRNPRRWQSKDR